MNHELALEHLTRAIGILTGIATDVDQDENIAEAMVLMGAVQMMIMDDAEKLAQYEQSVIDDYKERHANKFNF